MALMSHVHFYQPDNYSFGHYYGLNLPYLRPLQSLHNHSLTYRNHRNFYFQT